MLFGNLCLLFASRTHARTHASGCCRIQSWSIAWFDFWSALTDNYSTLWDKCWTVLKKRCDWLMSRKGKASWSHFQCLINLGVADFPRCRGQGGVTILFLVVFVSVLLLLLSRMYDSSPQWQKAVLLLVWLSFQRQQPFIDWFMSSDVPVQYFHVHRRSNLSLALQLTYIFLSPE